MPRCPNQASGGTASRRESCAGSSAARPARAASLPSWPSCGPSPPTRCWRPSSAAPSRRSSLASAAAARGGHGPRRLQAASAPTGRTRGASWTPSRSSRARPGTTGSAACSCAARPPVATRSSSPTAMQWTWARRVVPIDASASARASTATSSTTTPATARQLGQAL